MLHQLTYTRLLLMQRLQLIWVGICFVKQSSAECHAA